MKNLLLSASVLSLFVTACASIEHDDTDTAQAESISYPMTHRVSHQDNYHGTQVSDPYRWLEATQSEAVGQWIAAQNQLTNDVLTQVSGHEAMKQRLTQLWNFPRIGAPKRYGDYYFHFQNNGLENQSSLYVRRGGLDAVPERLLDPNQLSDDGSSSIARISISPNARYVGYAVSESGSDWVEWRIRDVHTGEDIDDIIRGVKFTQLSWLPDESGFYYSRYPDRPSGEHDDSRPVAIYFHRLGSGQSNDRRIYDISRFSGANPYPEVTQDGRFLIATIQEGFDSNAVHVLDLSQANARWQPIINQWDGRYQFIASDANLLFFHTTADAPNGRVIAIDMHRPQPEHWEEIIPAQENTLKSAHYIGGKFFAHYLESAHSQIDIFNAYGRHEQRINLPGMGTIQSIEGNPTHLEAFFNFSSFTQANTTYRFDIANNHLDIVESAQPHARFDKMQTHQIHYQSNDGDDVSMFILKRNDVELDGSNPTILYGYGGFNIALTPEFNPNWIAWVEQGGILAVPNLRGGGEYGSDWHAAGTGVNKQQVFDDAIAAAEYLIDHGYTSASQLAISGRSNGGLLVGATITQRPDLFAAALPDVGVFDMLRYHTTSANARAWRSDFGIASNAEDFTALHAYSPVHNVTDGQCYPATLITTGASDDRVAPWHSYKFAAALQYAQSCEKPILLRVEQRAGHGSGTPVWMRIEQASDQWTFLIKTLGLEALQSPTHSSNLVPIP